MPCQFARELVPAAGRLYGIDVADEVCNGYIGRRQFFDVTLFRREKCDRRVLAVFSDQITAASANWRVGIVMNFAPREVRHLRIEQGCERTKDTALSLAPQT